MGDTGEHSNRFVCPNDRQLALRAKLKTGWSIKTGTIGYQNANQRSKQNSSLDPDEQAAILDVINRAEQLELREQERVGKLIERLDNMRRNALGRGPQQCLLCGDRFGLLGAQSVPCAACSKPVCQKCAIEAWLGGRYTQINTVTGRRHSQTPPHGKEQWLCKICAETREIWKKSGAWFFKSLPKYVLPGTKKQGPGKYSPPSKTAKPDEDSSEDEARGLLGVERRNSTAESNTSPNQDISPGQYSRQTSSSTSSSQRSSSTTSIPHPVYSSQQIFQAEVHSPYHGTNQQGTNPHWTDDNASYAGNGYQASNISGSSQSYPQYGSYSSAQHFSLESGRRDSVISRTSAAGSVAGSHAGSLAGSGASESAPWPEDAAGSCLNLATWPCSSAAATPSISLTLSYAAVTSTLHLSLHRARNLAAMDVNGLADAFCRLSLVPEGKPPARLRTRTVHKTRNPEFKEAMAFYEATWPCSSAAATPSISLTLSYAAVTSTLHLSLHRARNLAAMDVNGLADAFCRLSLVPEGKPPARLRTRTVHKTRNPEFEEALALYEATWPCSSAAATPSISLTLSYAAVTSTLHLSLHRARNLAAMDVNGLADAFCRLSLVPEGKPPARLRTRTVHKTRNPEFEEAMAFYEATWPCSSAAATPSISLTLSYAAVTSTLHLSLHRARNLAAMDVNGLADAFCRLSLVPEGKPPARLRTRTVHKTRNPEFEEAMAFYEATWPCSSAAATPSISLTLSYAAVTSTLHLSLHRARNLAAMDVNGLADAFCRLSLVPEGKPPARLRTRTVHKSRNPEFHEAMAFYEATWPCSSAAATPSISLTLSYAAVTSTLHLSLHRARNLAAMDVNGLADAFCRLSLVPEGKPPARLRTRTVHKTRNPEFEEAMAFYEATWPCSSAAATPSISLTLSYAAVTSTLHLSLHRARNLAAMDVNGLADAFCRLSLVPEGKPPARLRTRTVHKTRNPEFEEALTFYEATWPCSSAAATPSISLTLSYAAVTSTLHLSLHRARNLAAMDVNGLADAFCRLSLVPEGKPPARLRTRTVHKTRNPEFEEAMAFYEATWPCSSAAATPSISLTLSYAAVTSTLHLSLHRARNLAAMDVNGLADAFCRLSLVPEGKPPARLRTRTVHKTRNPEFEEALTFYEVSEDDLLRKSLLVVVLDDDKFGKDYLGEAKVTLAGLRVQKCLSVTVPLDKTLPDDCSYGPDTALPSWFEDPWSRGQILISLSYSTKKRALMVLIVRCANLLPMDNNGFSDPFVKMHLKPDPHHRKHKTSIKWKNLNPFFNEEFLFETRPNELSTQSLYITVWDKDYGKSNDYLGGLVLGGVGSKGRRLKHWLDMIRYPDHRHEYWHNLTEDTLND